MNKSEKIRKLDNSITKGDSTAGITLIALIVTIIILIILAGISINLVLGENGIITKGQEAKEVTEQSKLNEEIATNELMEQWDEIVEGITTVEELKKEGKYTTKKTKVKDSYGNIIKIPEGFKIASDSGINIEEGIVIEDKDIIEGIGNNRGNQYVWIPVGDNIKKSDGTTVNITLGRYVFADGENHKDEEGIVLAKGTPILKQSADNYEEEIEINVKEINPTLTPDYEYKELKTNRVGVSSGGLDSLNATVLNLKEFIGSVEANGGYYIARYEASFGVDEKANSKVSNYFNNDTTTPTQEGYLWNNITQINAATASRGIYAKCNTDLINSYAWDTAIVYIQTWLGNTDYSYRNSKNTTLSNTGVNEDEVCKINDMSSNTKEWSTEYSTRTKTEDSIAYPCTGRGGYFNYTYYMASSRDDNNTILSSKGITFRSILYM